MVRRCEVLPEQSVIYVALEVVDRVRLVSPLKVVVRITSAIELECSLQSDPLASRGRLDICLLCSIETVYIALMVLGVMKLHDLSRDERFQCL